MLNDIDRHGHLDSPRIQAVHDRTATVRQRLMPGTLATAAAVVLHAFLLTAELSAADTLALWKITPDQSFTVQITTQRITEIRIGEYLDTTNTADHVTVQYTWSGYDRRGVARFEARITALDRTTTDADGNSTTESLNVSTEFRHPRVFVFVEDDGNSVNVSGTDSFFRSDSPQAQRVLQEICGPDVFQSWFDLPFRVPFSTTPPVTPQVSAEEVLTEQVPAVDEAALHPDSEWTRTHHVTLGLPGAIQCECVSAIDAIEESEARYSITGTVQFLPREPRQQDQLRFEEFQLTRSDVSGTGRIEMDQETELPRSIQLTQDLSLEGHGRVASGGTTWEIQLKQSLTLTSIASEFGAQKPQSDIPGGRQNVR